MMNRLPRGQVRNPLVSGPFVDHIVNLSIKKTGQITGGFPYVAPSGGGGITTTPGTDEDGKIYTIDVAMTELDTTEDPSARTS